MFAVPPADATDAALEAAAMLAVGDDDDLAAALVAAVEAESRHFANSARSAASRSSIPMISAFVSPRISAGWTV